MNKSQSKAGDGQQKTRRLVESLLAEPISFHRIFVAITGSVCAALLLSRAWFWKNNKTAVDRGGWFYKTRQDWFEETGLTRFEQETARKLLRDKKYIEERLRGMPAKTWLRVNRDAVLEAIAQLAGNQPTRRRKTSQQVGGKLTNKLATNQPAITNKTSNNTTKDTRTRKAAPAAPSQGVRVSGKNGKLSRHPLETVRRWARYQAQQNPGTIRTVEGLAHALQKDASADDQIDAWLEAERKADEAQPIVAELMPGEPDTELLVRLLESIRSKVNAESYDTWFEPI